MFKINLKSIMTFFVFFLLVNASKAQALMPTITPIVAFEKITVLQPEEHTQQRISYGVKVRIGPDLLGFEFSYLTGTFDKSFADGSEASSKTEKARAGLSSIFGGSFLYFTLGVGMEGRRESSKFINKFGAVTKIGPNDVLAPYASAHLNFMLTSNITFTSGVTYTFIDESNLFKLSKQREEFTLGFTIRI